MVEILKKTFENWYRTSKGLGRYKYLTRQQMYEKFLKAIYAATFVINSSLMKKLTFEVELYKTKKKNSN